MRPQHREVCFRVAQKHLCWIGVREPNETSDRWIGRPGFRAKPLECKAKTADNNLHPLAGLVVDPNVHPGAFSDPKAAKAKWDEDFLCWGYMPAHFVCYHSGPFRGALCFKNEAIFADYDLMSIVRSDERGQWLHTTDADEIAFIRKVIPELNTGFGLEMVQHPPEFDPDFKGLGARDREFVLWFGPGRQFLRNISSMPKDRPH